MWSDTRANEIATIKRPFQEMPDQKLSHLMPGLSGASEVGVEGKGIRVLLPSY